MNVSLKSSYYMQAWLFPVLFFYTFNYFRHGDVDLTRILINFIVSVVIVLGLSAFSTIFYNQIIEDVVSERSTDQRLSSSIKFHIVALITLGR